MFVECSLLLPPCYDMLMKGATLEHVLMVKSHVLLSLLITHCALSQRAVTLEYSERFNDIKDVHRIIVMDME